MARKELPTPQAPDTANLQDDVITPINEMTTEVYENLDAVNDILFGSDPVTFNEAGLSTSNANLGAFYVSEKKYDTVVTVSTITYRAASTSDFGSDRTIYVYIVNDLSVITKVVGEFVFTAISNQDVDIPVDFILSIGERVAIVSDAALSVRYAGSGGSSFLAGSGLQKIYEVGDQAVFTQTFTGGVIGFGWKGTTTVDGLATKAFVNEKNYLFGKKLNTIGDSMVAGQYVAAEDVWDNIIAERNSMNLINYGINGAYLSFNGVTANSLVANYDNMRTDSDYIIIFSGTNDAANLVTIGTDSSTDNTEFKGALNEICDGLITLYPDKKILFITPYNRNANYQDYVDAIHTICAKFSIPVFDNILDGGVCWTNTAQVASITSGDAYHLNEAGMQYVSTKYENKLMQL